ncbi:MAG: hypothetical protein RL662_1483, partial [Bacteroidota bacterium]
MNKQKDHQLDILKKLLLVFMLLGWIGDVYTQTTYPVQVYTQLTPPYSPYAPAYYSGGQAKMSVNIINTDIAQPRLSVYLRMKITSSTFSMITPPEVYTPVIELQAGVPQLLSLNDLEPYFRKENLRISGGQSQYYRTQMLPDNFYRFHFEVYEVHTNRLLSNPRVGFAQAMLSAGDPPILNLPQKGTAIQESNIPTILFSWTPRHMNSVASAYGTQYEISLVEIYDKQASPENAFQYSRTLYTEQTPSTSFVHTSAQPQLIPGMRYAWRVQALAKQGIENANVFKNEGYSQLSWFDYTGNCSPVTISGITVEGMKATINWQNTTAIEYIAEYRKKGAKRWYTAPPSGNTATLHGLTPDHTYEYRIGSRCYANDLWLYGDTKAFTMPAKAQKGPNCGLMPDVNITNRELATQLIPHLPIYAGDYPIFITQLNSSAGGRFSGSGYVGIPLFNLPKLNVKFQNIAINTDYQLIGGYIETNYDTKNNNALLDIDQTLTGGAGVGDIRTGEEKAQYTVSYTINPNIALKPLVDDRSEEEIAQGKPYTLNKNENGKYQVVLTDDQGNQHTLESDNLPLTLTDNQNKTYQIDQQGNLSLLTSKSDLKLNLATAYKVATDQFRVGFEEIEGVTKYAVDQYKEVYQTVTEYNQEYKFADREIAASAKFMLPQTSDKIAVKIIESKPTFEADKVRFITSTGKEYQASYQAEAKQWELNLVSSQVGDGQELFVVYQIAPDTLATVAQLNVYSYAPKAVKVKLVPVNGFSIGEVSEQVKAIYRKVGIDTQIETATNFAYEPLASTPFDVTGSGLFTTLTPDMQAINSAYISYLGDSYQQDVVYL